LDDLIKATGVPGFPRPISHLRSSPEPRVERIAVDAHLAPVKGAHLRRWLAFHDKQAFQEDTRTLHSDLSGLLIACCRTSTSRACSGRGAPGIDLAMAAIPEPQASPPPSRKPS
jgi:hypothetical protein